MELGENGKLTEFCAVIAAGGSGLRFGADIPKQFMPLRGSPVFMYSVKKFLSCNSLLSVVITVPENRIDDVRGIVTDDRVHVVAGGADRRQSVFNGLKYIKKILPEYNGVLLVHDAARPFVSVCKILETAEAAHKHGAAFLGVRVKDTVKNTTVQDGVTVSNGTPERESLFLAQTPQGFIFELLYNAHERAGEDAVVTDDASLLEAEGIYPAVVPGDYINIKITTKDDLEFAEYIINRESMPLT